MERLYQNPRSMDKDYSEHILDVLGGEEWLRMTLDLEDYSVVRTEDYSVVWTFYHEVDEIGKGTTITTNFTLLLEFPSTCFPIYYAVIYLFNNPERFSLTISSVPLLGIDINNNRKIINNDTRSWLIGQIEQCAGKSLLSHLLP